VPAGLVRAGRESVKATVNLKLLKDVLALLNASKRPLASFTCPLFAIEFAAPGEPESVTNPVASGNIGFVMPEAADED
jgi:hypothetical protein